MDQLKSQSETLFNIDIKKYESLECSLTQTIYTNLYIYEDFGARITGRDK